MVDGACKISSINQSINLAHRSASYIAYKYVCAIAVRKQYAGGRRVSSGQVEEGKWEESLDAFFLTMR